MSFLTEYFDEFRQHPIRKTKMCRPENRWAKLEGKWLDPKVGTEDKAWTDEEIEAFIKSTMRSLRGQSTYYNDYCAHLSPEFKTRPFKPREKKKRPCVSKSEKVEQEEAPPPQAAKLAMKDTELMKVAREIYEGDMDKPTLEPLPTHLRILGYVRPCLYRTGISEYQESIARLAYELIRDDRIPRYYAHNGCRPRWGLPPEGIRQPELDGIPFASERLF
ncbi:uncharacterized protein LOC115455568 [Manduca sexta]|uniref:Uncharacterized protein n=1 Tax=Manduca sexta TaxID=7130 RepID=A0A922CE46_MANSE|nr:uncharacterized protein LOC115455568 [Manduca sexta]KAG6442896.1 hypothetical protein O3G_MSEX002577 [Manduca sexta]